MSKPRCFELRHALLVTFVAATSFLGRLEALTRQQVFVCFEFGGQAYRDREGPNNEYITVEQNLSALLREIVSQESFYRHWTFADCQPDGYPRLRVWLRDAADMDIHVAVVLEQNGTESGKWHSEMFGVGEISQLGALGTGARWWRPWVERGFRRWLRENDEKMRLLIAQQVPLGTVVAGAEPPPLAILPLDWRQHSELASSEFLVLFRAPDGNRRLLSKGRETCRDYPADPPFKGILVAHLWRLDDGGQTPLTEADLADLTPRSFYLKEFRVPVEIFCEGASND